MMQIPSPTCSTSIVLSRVPSKFTEDDVRAIFSAITPCSKVVFHWYSDSLFSHKCTVVFPDLAATRKVMVAFLGKFIGEYGQSIAYSFIPNNLSETEPPGQMVLRNPLDDLDVPSAIGDSSVYVDDWKEYTVFPKTVPTTTRSCCMRYNFITELSFALPFVTNLNLKGNMIKIIGENIKFPMLTRCNLSFNQLEHLPNLKQFAPKLANLDVSYNQLVDIDPSISSLPRLINFNCSFNKIKSLPALPQSVNKLDVHQNKIETVANFPLNPLIKFNFAENSLSEFPQSFRGQVKELLFTKNPIRTFTVDYLANGITSLTLAQGKLETVPSQLFHIQSLKSVCLRTNCLEEIPDDFSSSHIISFDISENPIQTLPLIPRTLEDLRLSFTNINDLSVCIPPENKIVTLHANCLKLEELPSLPCIENLFVAVNRLTELPHITKRPYSQLNISASHNQISSIKFENNQYNLFDLSFNKLTVIPDSIFTMKSHIDLSSNPIQQDLPSEKLELIDCIDISHTQIKIIGDIPDLVREIVADTKPAVSPEVDENRVIPATSSFVFDYDYSLGYSETIGMRNDMEDALVILQKLYDDVSMYAIFDGHGGKNVARFAAICFPEKFRQARSYSNDTVDRVIEEFHQTLVSTNETSGSTMEMIFIDHDKIYDSHIGDARFVLFRSDGSVKFTTVDQRPEEEKQFSRLRNEKIPLRRLKTAGLLGTAGAIGDVQYPGVNRKAEINEITIEEDDKWIVLACDGVWDEMTNEDVGCTLLKTSTPQEAAVLIRDQAYSRGSEDNISVIVIDLSLRH